MTEITKEPYHGWVIQISQEPAGYTFECWRTQQQLGVTTAQSYTTFEQALRAGQLRADLESVRLSLTGFLHGKLRLLQLNSNERDALENSIAQYIDTAQHQFS